MGGDALVAEHQPEPQVGAIVVGAWAIEHLERADAGIGAQHRGELAGRAGVGRVDQRGMAGVEHAERAVVGQTPGNVRRRDRSRRTARFDEAIAPARGRLEYLLDHFLIDHDLRRERCRGTGGQGKQQGGANSHARCNAPTGLSRVLTGRVKMGFALICTGPGLTCIKARKRSG